jgi:mRNA interferase YafQ
MGCSPVCTRTIEHTNKFKRDYKREIKGKSRAYVRELDAELAAVVQVLRTDGTLDQRHYDHPLSGKWKDYRDCHVRPDLVLIYRKPDQDTLTLVRFGSHSELGL